MALHNPCLVGHHILYNGGLYVGNSAHYVSQPVGQQDLCLRRCREVECGRVNWAFAKEHKAA